jgi:hypothetical protein
MSYVRDDEQTIMEEEELQNHGGLCLLGQSDSPFHWWPAAGSGGFIICSICKNHR